MCGIDDSILVPVAHILCGIWRHEEKRRHKVSIEPWHSVSLEALKMLYTSTSHETLRSPKMKGSAYSASYELKNTGSNIFAMSCGGYVASVDLASELLS